MKKLLVGFIVVLSSLFSFSQVREMPKLPTVSAMKTYTGGGDYVFVTASEDGGLFFLYTGPDPADESTIYAGAGGRKWKRYSTSSGGGGAYPGGSGSEMQYRIDGTTFGGAAGTSWDNTNRLFTSVKTSLGTTQTLMGGWLLSNTTAATNNNQQVSPAYWAQGAGWGTSGSSSQSVRMGWDVLPVQGTAPTGKWRLLQSVNGGSITEQMSYESSSNTLSLVGATSGRINFTSASNNNYINVSTRSDIILSSGSISSRGSTWTAVGSASPVDPNSYSEIGFWNFIATNKPQLVAVYNTTNYATFEASNSGNLTVTPSGGNTTITGGLVVTALDTDGSAPATSGTTKMVITDGDGRLSFTDIPAGGGGGITGFTDGNGFDGTVAGSNLSLTTQLSQGSVPFIGSGGALLQDNSNFFWDNTNKRLGIKDNTPSYELDVTGQIGINGLRFAYYPSGLADDGSTIGIGQGALNNHTIGLRNVAIGLNALAAITGGYDNVAIGSRALDVLSGNNNTNVAIGKDAGGGLTSGSGNVFIGSSAATSATSGSNNIAIGSSAALPSNTGSNQLNIGNSLFSNTLGDNNFLLGFGGVSSSYPGLRRSSTVLELKLADNSDYTWLYGKIYVPAGSTSGPSFRFTSGSLSTEPNSGAMEYDGTNFYLSPNSVTRYRVVLSNNVTPSAGQILVGNGAYYTVGNITSIDGSVIVTANSSGINLSVPNTAQSGTYTPLATPVTNIDVLTPNTCYWMRVGNVVHVAGSIYVDPNTGGSFDFEITLPVITSFITPNDLIYASGMARIGVNDVDDTAFITAADGNKVRVAGYATNGTPATWKFHFTYLVVGGSHP